MTASSSKCTSTSRGTSWSGSRAWTGARSASSPISRRTWPAAGPDQEEVRAQKIADFRERFANPFIAAERGYIDDVIEPRETRPRVIRALRMLENKVDTMPRKKHGNIPL